MRHRSTLDGRSISSKQRARRAKAFSGLEALDPRTMFATVFCTVLHDLNGNGIKDTSPEEGKLEGWTVFADYNRDGVLTAGEPSAVTDADGEAFIAGIVKGTWDIREVLPAGWSPAPGWEAFDRIGVKTNGGSDTDPEFLNVASIGGAIEGTVWSDNNGDGIQDPDDVGIPGWTVYLDLDDSRTLDAGEPSTVTDTNGYYLLSDLETGTYRVTEVVPAGWDTTLGYDSHNNVDVTPGVTSVNDFGNFSTLGRGTINGTVWSDVNADGFRAAGDLGLESWLVYLDLNNNDTLDGTEPSQLTDAAGAYSFPNLLAGSYTVNEVVEAGYFVSPSHSASVTVTVSEEGTPTVDFANYTPADGGVVGTVWNDLNANGIQDGAEAGLPGWTVFIDANGDGVPSAGELTATTNATGDYLLSPAPVGTVVIREVPGIGWSPTAPATGMQTITIPNATTLSNIDFGNKQRTDGAISGTIFADRNGNSLRDPGERGLGGMTIYIDTNNNSVLDAGEPSMQTSVDLFYTPTINEAGNYSFTHLSAGTYTLREIVPVEQSATPLVNRGRTLTLIAGEDRQNFNFANTFRANEVHGIKFDDLNNDGVHQSGEPTMGGITMYIDLDRDNVVDAGEPTTISAADGTYSFVGLSPDAYVVRESTESGHVSSYPTTTGGILWPSGVSHPAQGNVSPTLIQQSLDKGQTYSTNVSLTLPNTGSLTDKVDVFLLFDDTGSFTGNSPIVRAAFPQIISSLQTALPGLDLGFGVGRFEEYGNYAAELGTGRPFILNQPIVAQSVPGYDTAIQAALNRTAPGYGGDGPETDIEALFQTVTGRGFDGNNNGNTSDSGAAGLANTQLNPGNSGDVPSFSSFTPDAANNVLAPSGTIGGAGFRAGALPIVLLATDIGFAYQPKGETSITGVNGVTLPVSQLTQTSRPDTPFNSGAGIQETITALNALGALVVGLGTNPQATIDPRQQLEAIAKLTGAVNNSTTTIANGTTDAIAPGDPFYFQIASGFGASVANGIVNAIQNAVTNTAMNITLKASDPRVHVTSTPGVVNNVGAGETANFNVTFTGDGIPHRFDLQFIKEGTDVVVGSIPVVLGTPIVGDGYEFDDLEDGEIETEDDFGSHSDRSSGGEISGTIFEDRDDDGVKDASDPAEAGVVVYIDENHDGSHQSGERSTITSPTGSYTFTGLADGTYTVRQVAPAATAGAAGQSVTLAVTSAPAQDFSNVPVVFSGAVGGRSYTVTGNGTRADISVDGVPTYSVNAATTPSLTFDASTGDEHLIVDLAGINPALVQAIHFVGGDSNDQIEVRGTGLSDAMSVSSTTITRGSTSIDFAGAGQLALRSGDYDVTGDLNGIDLLVSGATARTKFSQKQNLGSLTIDGGAHVSSTGNGAGVTALTVNQLAINNGALALLATGTGGQGTSDGVAKVNQLTIGAAGALDIGNNALIIPSTGKINGSAITADSLRALLVAGLAGGTWNGLGGINSSVFVDSGTDAVGFVDNANPLFLTPIDHVNGVSLAPSDFAVKHTAAGDANLDGVVDDTDVAMIGLSYDHGATAGHYWFEGDLNHDGMIDDSDVAIIGLTYAPTSAPLSPASATVSLASAPVAPAARAASVASDVLVGSVDAKDLFAVTPILA